MMGRAFSSNCYCVNLRRSAGAVSNYYDRALSGLGITASQFYLLFTLDRLEYAHGTQLAEAVGLDRSTMVRNVRLLVEHGWIQEVVKGRGKNFSLTASGKAVLEQGRVCWESAQSGLESYLGEADTKAILRIGEKLKNLE